MIDIIVSIINLLIIPMLLWVMKKVYYINHKVSEIEVHIYYIRNELEEVRKHIFK